MFELLTLLAKEWVRFKCCSLIVEAADAAAYGDDDEGWRRSVSATDDSVNTRGGGEEGIFNEAVCFPFFCKLA